MSTSTITGDRARVADVVATERHRRRMSQRELAAAAGVAPNTVVRVEAGKGVREASLAAMLDALDVDPTSLADADDRAEGDTAAEIARAFVDAGADADERKARMLHIVRAVGAY